MNQQGGHLTISCLIIVLTFHSFNHTNYAGRPSVAAHGEEPSLAQRRHRVTQFSSVQLSSAPYSSIPRPHLLPTACLGTPDRARAQREAHRSMGRANKWASITCTQCAKALVYQHSSNTDLTLECRASPLHASRASYPDHIDLKRNSSLKRAELN